MRAIDVQPGMTIGLTEQPGLHGLVTQVYSSVGSGSVFIEFDLDAPAKIATAAEVFVACPACWLPLRQPTDAHPCVGMPHDARKAFLARECHTVPTMSRHRAGPC